MISAESVSIPRNARSRRTTGQNSGSVAIQESRSSSACLRVTRPVAGGEVVDERQLGVGMLEGLC